MRMGAANERAIKAKLRELRAEESLNKRLEGGLERVAPWSTRLQ